jgi:protein involved in polysaccharide export with SLBB domain
MAGCAAFMALALAAIAPFADAAESAKASAEAARSPAVAGESSDAFADVRRVIEGYKLGPDDHVKVVVFGEETLTGDFAVGSTGKISMPLIGDMQAAGLTVQQLTAEIAKALSDGYLKDPKVSAEIIVYRPFFILGEVNKPGTYPYTNALTVQNAVATAGGYTYRANTHKVFIKHEGDTQEHEVPLSGTVPVAPGDSVRIGERLF